MQWSKENDNSTNNDLQNITQKTKDRAARIPLKCGGCFGICSQQVLLVTDDYISKSQVFTDFRLLTDFVCLYTYEF